MSGSKRKRDCFSDSFNNWNEYFLCDSTLNTEASDIVSSGSIDELINNPDCSESHIDKKRKLCEDEELSLFISDARSRSPPFQPIDFDLDALPADELLSSPTPETPPIVAAAPIQPTTFSNVTPSPNNTPTHLSTTLNIISQTDAAVRTSMFESLTRMASNIEHGKSSVSYSQTKNSLQEQMAASQDYLTLQTIFGIPMRPPVMKPESSPYYQVTNIPFVMNSSYSVPNIPLSKAPLDVESFIYKQKPMVRHPGAGLFANTPCNNKNIVYSGQPKFLSPQYQTAILPAQNINIYPNLHVL